MLAGIIFQLIFYDLTYFKTVLEINLSIIDLE